MSAYYDESNMSFGDFDDLPVVNSLAYIENPVGYGLVNNEHGSPLIWEKPEFKIIPKTLSWIPAMELVDSASAPNYLIDNIIESKSHGIIAGSSQSFKSFCVLKMANAIATGQDFFGHDVYETGKVLYICGEGMGALNRRLKALHIVEGSNNNLLIKSKPLSIDKEDDMDWLRYQITDIKPVLVIFDTFSSLATSTKENVNDEVASCLKYVSGCCVDTNTSTIIVHHYGKDTEKGSRGASAFSANVDFELSMTRTGSEADRTAKLSCKKSKDGEYFKEIDIKAHIVELGIFGQNGKQSTSLVLKGDCNEHSLTDRQQKAYDSIRELISSSGFEFDKKLCIHEKMINSLLVEVFDGTCNNVYSAAKKLIESLKKKGLIHEKDGNFWL